MYDFLNFDWRLPHWDFEILSFWASVPLNLRKDQSLYKSYLKDYNYKGLFRDFESYEPYATGFVDRVKDKLFRLLYFLKVDRNPLEKYLSYFGLYSNYYSWYSFFYFLKNIKKAKVPPEARGVIALHISKWLQDNNFPDIGSCTNWTTD